RPRISILTPTYNTDPEALRSCIRSVQAQLYSNWEFCICDDASSSQATRDLIANSAQHDSRIKFICLPSNRGVCGATNTALRLASGVYVGLLDHDDELSPDALYECVKLLQDHPEADVIYSDEDKLERDGTRSEPFFKPDWSPELLLSGMYTCHFGLYRRELVETVGAFRPGFEGSQDYDLMLRFFTFPRFSTIGGNRRTLQLTIRGRSHVPLGSGCTRCENICSAGGLK
ncbi:MAG: hypothetical protein DMG70_06560, partial [Acidobacteria bacterium]